MNRMSGKSGYLRWRLRQFLLFVRLRRDSVATFLIAASATAALTVGAGAIIRYVAPRPVAVGSLVDTVELAALRHQIDQLKADVYSEGAPVSKVDEGRVLRLEQDFEEIKRSLGEDVNRALAVPIMRRDIEDLKQQTSESIQILQNDVNRLYDALFWLMGIVVTIALSALGLLISRKSSSRT